MKRVIKKVAILGSGVMGSRIACHFANIGMQVLLLDIVPKDAPENDKKARNKIVDDALAATLKSNPSPIYSKSFINRISTGNMTDDMHKIADYDWVIEVVVERLDIKKQVFENVEKFRKPGTLITSNTSGIPIHLMTEGRSEDFKKHFCGTHFFNPPRYLKLLEIIPTPDTDKEVVNFLLHFGEKYLGKTTVLAKDTPAFIGNRIGTYSIMQIFHYALEKGFTVDEVDKLTGPVVGRAKSATFRTADVVGLDTLALVATGLKNNVPHDESVSVFDLPPFLQSLLDNKWLGSKTNQGFFKKVQNEKGKSEIHSINFNTLEYALSERPKFASLDSAKSIDDLKQRIKFLVNGKDRAGQFYRDTIYPTLVYASNRIPEISDDLYRIDDAISAGFGWELGPFQIWDALGVDATVKQMEAAGLKPAQWVYDMLAAGVSTFYKAEDGNSLYYNIPQKAYQVIPGTEEFISLENLSADKVIWKNNGVTVTDIGDGILNVEFHTKMNTIGGEVLTGLNKAIDLAEASYKGVVISNEGANFSAGANVGLIFMMAIEQDYDELNMAVKAFQDATMRLRYSSIPVVVAPHNMTLGGGCEMCLHADMVVAHAESYIGLVEFGVGLIPGGGGTKEFALRLGDSLKDGDVELNTFRDRFLTIGQAKVSTSAQEAFELGYLVKGRDRVVVSYKRLLAEAKNACLELAEAGYVQPTPRVNDIKVLGKDAVALANLGADSMKSGAYISEHDELISKKLGGVLAGGELSQEAYVSEKYLLDLERKAFLELTMQKKTLERLQSIVNGGKILRN